MAGTHAPFVEAARRRQDKGNYQWWEIARPCDYYLDFDKPKIFWPDMAKQPRLHLGRLDDWIGNKPTFMITGLTPYLLGCSNASRVTWFAISHLCLAVWRASWHVALCYRLFTQFISRLPIPDAAATDRDVIAALALAITEQARARYALHQKTRHRILTDLGVPGASLNQKLTAWWDLDFPGFLAQVRAALKREIPVRQRDDWEEWLTVCRGAHAQRTAAIVRLETQLNRRVYDLFDLAPAEVKIIEESTKYRYGEV